MEIKVADLILCLLLLPLWESVIVLCFVVRYFMSILVLQSSWWGRESWLLCLICLPGQVSRDGWAALPHDATGLSAVCDCGISWSYSLTIFVITPTNCLKGILPTLKYFQYFAYNLFYAWTFNIWKNRICHHARFFRMEVFSIGPIFLT